MDDELSMAGKAAACRHVRGSLLNEDVDGTLHDTHQDYQPLPTHDLAGCSSLYPRIAVVASLLQVIVDADRR